jgi:hypothetical protein
LAVAPVTSDENQFIVRRSGQVWQDWQIALDIQ